MYKNIFGLKAPTLVDMPYNETKPTVSKQKTALILN